MPGKALVSDSYLLTLKGGSQTEQRWQGGGENVLLVLVLVLPELEMKK